MKDASPSFSHLADKHAHKLRVYSKTSAITAEEYRRVRDAQPPQPEPARGTREHNPPAHHGDPNWWLEFRNCKNTPTKVFYAEEHHAGIHAYPEARRVCAACPVRSECLEYVLSLPRTISQHGYWGGKTPIQRKRILSQRAAERRAAS